MDNELLLPDEENSFINLTEILDNTNLNKIYITSDWHLFKNHYKKEANYVNTQKIVTWCRQNIKDNDVFMYLGDISFRYCNEKDTTESAKIMSSIPGIKVLIAGNHDKMLGYDYLYECGFNYIFDEFIWKKLIFTHKPINMAFYPDDHWNIHGHIHKWRGYDTTDGKRNINVYPYFFNNKPVTLEYILNHKEKLIKGNYWINNTMLGESNILETKRSNLPNSAFGIPEDRKYPLDTKQHIKSAIKLFGHCDEDKKKKLALNIRKAAKKYDISIPETTQCYKYLTENGIESIIPKDVTNIVFDMGGVIVGSDFKNQLHRSIAVSHVMIHKIEEYIEKYLFNNKELHMMNLDQVKNYFLSVVSENIKPFVPNIFKVIGSSIYKFNYVDELLNILRSKGYNIYYLSNWDKWQYELEKNFFDPIINKFDGGIFSFKVNALKPEEKIYKIFFDKYNLDQNKCFFFDDKSENIITAENLGMKGYLFNDNETPKLLLHDNIDIPSDINNTVLINSDVKLESINLDKLYWYYCSDFRNPSDSETGNYFKSINDAVRNSIKNYKFIDNNYIEKYVFKYVKNNKYIKNILIGKIIIYSDGNYEWEIQYPLSYKDGELISSVSEWSMASMNPIIGITKPFILKIYNDNNSVINTKQYVFSPDIISDKYLAINEDSKLEIVDSDKFKDCYIEIYEYIGNKYYLNKIEEAYKSGKIVDNTFFYTSLSRKPMLCEDQIDFDPNFKKVDFDAIKEDTLSKLASIRDTFLELNGIDINNYSLIESSYNNQIPFLNKYNKHGDISVRKDFDGYYFYSKYTNKRSSSVDEISLLTENMIITIL